MEPDDEDRPRMVRGASESDEGFLGTDLYGTADDELSRSRSGLAGDGGGYRIRLGVQRVASW